MGIPGGLCPSLHLSPGLPGHIGSWWPQRQADLSLFRRGGSSEQTRIRLSSTSPSSAGLPGWQSLRFSVTSPSLFLPCSLIFIVSPHEAFLILRENSPTASNWEQELPSLPAPSNDLTQARGSVLISSCYSRHFLLVFTSLGM